MNKEISETTQNYIKEFEENTGATVIYVTVSGSKLYGTDNENSDTDLKGIFIPSKESVILKKDLSSYVRDTNNSKIKNSAEDIDFTLHSIYSFFGQLQKSETGAIDVLFSMFRDDTVVYKKDEAIDSIKENYKIFLNSNMKSFIGYALGQVRKFNIKGNRYNELKIFNEFIGTLNGNNKLSEYFEIIEEHILKNEYNYIKLTEAKTNRVSNKTGIYCNVLGKMFEGTVSLGYFRDRIGILENSFGNRTKSQKDSNIELINELKGLKDFLN